MHKLPPLKMGIKKVYDCLYSPHSVFKMSCSCSILCPCLFAVTVVGEIALVAYITANLNISAASF